jgi:DNA mismatch endonuclease (patch repair protein)
MRAIKRTDTKPEIELRSSLHRAGYRFRKDLPLKVGGTRVRPDIVFTARKLAIFIDGCFWHCCPAHGRQPGVNSEYWAPKLRRNVERDRMADVVLRTDGWSVIRIWEHVPVEDAIELVRTALQSASR